MEREGREGGGEGGNGGRAEGRRGGGREGGQEGGREREREREGGWEREREGGWEGREGVREGMERRGQWKEGSSQASAHVHYLGTCQESW